MKVVRTWRWCRHSTTCKDSSPSIGERVFFGGLPSSWDTHASWESVGISPLCNLPPCADYREHHMDREWPIGSWGVDSRHSWAIPVHSQSDGAPRQVSKLLPLAKKLLKPAMLVTLTHTFAAGPMNKFSIWSFCSSSNIFSMTTYTRLCIRLIFKIMSWSKSTAIRPFELYISGLRPQPWFQDHLHRRMRRRVKRLWKKQKRRVSSSGICEYSTDQGQ